MAKARVLIVARDEAGVRPLAEGLERLGWASVTAYGPYAAMAAAAAAPIEAAIIDLAGDEGDAEAMARRLKAACAPRRVPILAMAPQARQGFDLTLPHPPSAQQAAARLETLVRLAIAEEEIELRTATFAERGVRLSAPAADPRPISVLVVGEPAPRFLALSHALGRAGAQAVAAFTAYTAFDYLHDRAFEAVVLWLGETGKDGLAIAAGMRRNTRLYHVPALLCLEPGQTLDRDEAFARGLSDLALPDADAAEVAAWVVELAYAYRRQCAVRGALDRARATGLMDPATGLFTRELFAGHLRRLARASRERGRPLSLAVLRLDRTPAIEEARSRGFLAKAMPQIGTMIGRLVRCEDTAARLASEIFAIAMPGTDLASARAASERIAAVIACTAFDAGAGRPPFAAAFEIGAAETPPGESPVAALERALADAQPFAVAS